MEIATRLRELLKALETRELTSAERAELDELQAKVVDATERLGALEAEVGELADEAAIAASAATAAEAAAEAADSSRSMKQPASGRMVPPGAPKFIRSAQETQKMSDSLVRSWLLRGTPASTTEGEKLLATRGMVSDSLEVRAGLLSSTTPGSYSREESTLLGSFEQLLTEYSDYAKFCRKIQTESGEPLRICIDADSAKGYIIPETNPDSEVDIALDLRTVNVHQYSSGIALLSYEVLKDQKVGLERLVSEALAMRVSRIIGETFTNGTGTGQPLGLLKYVDDAAQGSAKIASVTTAAAGAISVPDLVSLYASLPSHTQASSSTRWFMSPAAYQAYLKLSDGMQRPFGFDFNTGVGNSPFGTIMGKQISVLPDLETVATGKFPVLIGNPDQLIFRTVGNYELQTTRELYFKTRQIGVRVLFRAGFSVLDGNQFRALKVK